MISKSTLQKAAQKKIISDEQVEALYQFIQKEDSGRDYSLGDSNAGIEGNNEPLKFIRGFGDVFITLGIVFLAISINMASLSGLMAIVPVAGFVILAEWLVRIRRLVLPGMAILIVLLIFIHKGVTSTFGIDATSTSLVLISVSSFLFYLRYKMPFSLLPFAASLVAMSIMQIGLDVLQSPLIFSGFGLLVFVIALWFDAQDTHRESHLSDSAFWLHLLAAPLIVHGVMMSMLFSEQTLLSAFNKEMLIFTFFSIFFLLALFIDRRAMLISTQLYVIYATTQVLTNNLGESQNIMIYILIILGLFVIYFGAYWYKTRNLIFGFMSGMALSRYVPDFTVKDTK